MNFLSFAVSEIASVHLDNWGTITYIEPMAENGACSICGNENHNKTFVALDMAGDKEEFEYLECSECGCLQLRNVPDDLANYYPDDYYSYTAKDFRKIGDLEAVLKRARARHLLGERTIIGRLMAGIFRGELEYPWYLQAGVKVDFRILDVGCGSGDFLLNLYSHGFKNIQGIDKFISEDIRYDKHLSILKKSIYEIDGPFDFIMLHHSFEHMPDPLKALKRLNELLRRERYVLIRIPVAQSYAWRKYGASWVGIDAPRHLFLHTKESMAILAGQSGFKIRLTVYDSLPLQFWASEQYSRGIAGKDANSYHYGLKKSIFSLEDIEYFEQKTRELNQTGDGDAACFYLYKS